VELTVRDALIRTRTRYVAVVKARVRREGLRVPGGDPEHTVAKLKVCDGCHKAQSRIA